MCLQGVKFVDPQFPPIDKSLYTSSESATSWKCRTCSKRNPLPPAPQPEELFNLMRGADAAKRMVRCAHCASESHALEVALRPSGWGRPSDLRDDVTLQFSSVPWVVVRDQPRPDDIRQGHVGNWCARPRPAPPPPRTLPLAAAVRVSAAGHAHTLPPLGAPIPATSSRPLTPPRVRLCSHTRPCSWFVCAMSALAEDPENVRRILVTREYNHAGVYQVPSTATRAVAPPRCERVCAAAPP